MAKDKKVKKGRAGEIEKEVEDSTRETDRDLPHDISHAPVIPKDVTGNKLIDNVSEEVTAMSLENISFSKGKNSKRESNKAEFENGFSDNESGKQKSNVTDKEKSSKKTKTLGTTDESVNKQKKDKGKKVKAQDLTDEFVNTIAKSVEALHNEADFEKKKKKKTSKNKVSGFQLLDVEGDNVQEDEDVDANNSSPYKEATADFDSNEQKTNSKATKKSKKKERKRKDADDEDIDKLLEQLALEMSGQVPVPMSEVSMESKCVDSMAAGDVDSKESKKQKIEKVNSEVTENKIKETELDIIQHSVKTASQKKKDKKEKEKQKKLSQYEQKGPTKNENEDVIVGTLKQSSASSESQEKGMVEEVENVPNEEETDDKKKKKKKDEDEKKDKKRPGKKQIAAMQEALKKVKEEEERLRLEEEEKIKEEEEMERLREEKLRLDQEKKERRKQREKEKRERLKAEGKLLSKSQKQSKARMEATLAVLRQQGVDVPQVGGGMQSSAPRLRDRRWTNKKKNQDSQDIQKTKDSGIAPVEIPEILPEKIEIEKRQVLEQQLILEDNVEEHLNVKDAWDESSDDESELCSKMEIVLTDKDSVNTDQSESEDSVSDEESDTSDSESGTSTESEESKTNEERIRERALERIKKRQEEAENNRSIAKLRSPVVCVLGHVDTGKTKILDRIRRTHVQDSEAGGITQQIGATMVPEEALKEQCKIVKSFSELDLKVPGLLIIDTPGHESFSNLRSRGSSLCDIAILVVDIMHGLEPQTIESIDLLKQKKTPFIVALNKIDRLYEWKSIKNRDIQDVVKNQARNTKMEFDDRAKEVIVQFAEQGLNAVLFYDNKDPRSYISMVPTSAMTGDGMGNLMALVVQLTQSMMAKRLAFSEELQATVLEVKAIPGLGTTIDAILVNGRLHEGDTVIMAGYEGPLVTQIRSILMPQPLKELRVKNFYEEFKEVQGAQGVKLTGKDLDKAIAGLQLLVAQHPDEVQVLKDEVAATFREAMSCIKLAERGVYVQASTLGSLEALLDFLKTSKIPYSGIRIGPVVKKDVMKASIMLEHDGQFAVILAFDVKIERDAQELADSLGVKIFHADIIYHLFDKFTAHREELKNKKRDEFKNIAVFPCKLRILPQYIFNSRDPIVLGVIVEAGIVREGTPLCVPSKEFLEIGIVTTIEVNHKAMEMARKGQEVCIKIEAAGGEAPKMFGRHFEHTDLLVSKITRQSIDVCKEYFRDDLLKTDWQLMVELKKTFQIL